METNSNAHGAFLSQHLAPPPPGKDKALGPIGSSQIWVGGTWRADLAGSCRIELVWGMFSFCYTQRSSAAVIGSATLLIAVRISLDVPHPSWALLICFWLFLFLVLFPCILWPKIKWELPKMSYCVYTCWVLKRNPTKFMVLTTQLGKLNFNLESSPRVKTV